MWLRRCLVRSFVVHKRFMSHLDKVSDKIRSRRSVTDMKRLQGLLENTTSNGSLKEKINRTAASDKNFDSFLQEFREKNKGQVNIMDFSRFYDENNRLKNDEKLRQDEIDMLKEFMARGKDREKKENEIKEDLGYHVAPGEYMNNRNNAFNPQFYALGSKFMYLIIDRGVTTQVTRLNRVNHFRYMVFAGNSDGIVGYGKGQGLDFENALINAMKDLKKNLVALDLGEENTFPLELKNKFSKVHFKMEPMSNFNSWGNPVLSTMIQLCGIEHVRFNNYFRTPNRYGLLYVFMKTVCQNKSIETLCELKGVKPFQLGLTKGYNQLSQKYRKFVAVY